MLLYLLAVVVVAVIGGMAVAVGTAIAAAFLINYFFVKPEHTLEVAQGEQALALAVFLVVAAVVSWAVETAARRARAAERPGPQARRSPGSHEATSRRARRYGGYSNAPGDLRHGVGHAQRPGAPVRRLGRRGEAGWAPPGEEAPLRFDVPIGTELRLIGRGPALFAEDQRVLQAFAAAAQTAYEGHRLSERAGEARELAAADRQRTALLAAVGHDLRTPLAGIKASVSTLRQTDVQWSEEQRRELLAAIEESADRLDAIVENLLDASRLEAGALSVQPEPVALDEVIAAALLSVPGARDASASTSPRTCRSCRRIPGCSNACSPTSSRTPSVTAVDGPVEVVARAGESPHASRSSTTARACQG